MRPIAFILALIFGSFILVACDQSGPIKIGFIAELEGRGSDTGMDSLNALQLAAQQINAQGGIDGRMIEIIPRDDLKSPEVAQQLVHEFAELRVDAIVGPIISSIGMAMLPVINELGIVTVSPTVSAADFVGFRDYLFRMNTTTRENARTYAKRSIEEGRVRVANALDGQNEAFAESWYREFLLEFEEREGRVISKVWINSNDITHADAASQLVEDLPDGIVLITNGADSASLAKEIRKLDADVALSAAEWAGTNALIELGGKAVEGLELLQAYDRYDTNPRYQKFLTDFTKMFDHPPSYSAVLTYDAATMLFGALKTKHPDQTLANALISLPPQQGLHQDLVFDQYGDGNRSIYFVAIQNGKFIRVR